MRKPIFCLLLALSAACTPFSSTAQSSPTNGALNENERAALFPNSEDIETGRKLAEANCGSCHGLNGISQDSQFPHLAGQRTIYLYREMLAYKDGKRSSTVMADALELLESDALLKTAIYYSSLTPPFDREGHENMSELVGDLDEDPMKHTAVAAASCGNCHGPGGNSLIPGMPSLTAQHPDTFVKSMLDYQEGKRANPMMKTLALAFDESALEEMGLYYALLEPSASSFPGSGDPEAGRITSAACASCHGDAGNATGPDMPSLAGQDARYLATAMKAYVNGQRNHEAMKLAMEGLDSHVVDDMAAFYAAQLPERREVRKPLTTAQWLERCSRCHGAAGNSTDPRYARLSGQNQEYLARVLGEYAAGDRQDSIMHAMSEPLSESVIEKLALFYSLQEPRSVVYFDIPCTEAEE